MKSSNINLKSSYDGFLAIDFYNTIVYHLLTNKNYDV